MNDISRFFILLYITYSMILELININIKTNKIKNSIFIITIIINLILLVRIV